MSRSDTIRVRACLRKCARERTPDDARTLYTDAQALELTRAQSRASIDTAEHTTCDRLGEHRHIRRDEPCSLGHREQVAIMRAEIARGTKQTTELLDALAEHAKGALAIEAWVIHDHGFSAAGIEPCNGALERHRARQERSVRERLTRTCITVGANAAGCWVRAWCRR